MRPAVVITLTIINSLISLGCIAAVGYNFGHDNKSDSFYKWYITTDREESVRVATEIGQFREMWQHQAKFNVMVAESFEKVDLAVKSVLQEVRGNGQPSKNTRTKVTNP